MVAYTPICQSIIMTGEALANAHKKFLSDYQATVGVGDIDEDKIQAEIDGYQELLRSLDDLIRTAKTYKPDLEQRSMRAYEAMQKRQEKLEKLRTYSALSASFFSEYESSQQELTNGLAQVKNCTAWNASTGTFDISKLNMNWAKDISTRWKNREVAKATQKEEAFNNNLKKLEAYTIYAWPYEDPVTGEVTVNWFIDKDGRRLDNSELQNFLEQHGTELDPSYYHIVDWKKIRDLENDALRRGETYITGQKYEGLSKGSMQLSGYISTGYAFAQDSGLYDLAMIAGLSYAGAKTKVSSPKKASGAVDDIKIPSVRNNEFSKWFDNLTSEQLEELWKNPEIRKKIEDRIRRPGGYHEWHLVSRTPTFKKWGVSMDDIKELRTLTKDVEFVNPSGWHGGRGSTKAHNEILKIIDNATDYDNFVVELNEWASRRLKNGVSGLPEGLRR